MTPAQKAWKQATEELADMERIAEQQKQRDAEITALRAEVASKNDQFQAYARRMEAELNSMASEVERLRAENKQLQEYNSTVLDPYTDLRAEVERLREELSIWKSVFPDIAPERVLPDRSKLEVEVERLRDELRRWMTGEEVRIMQTDIERLEASLATVREVALEEAAKVAETCFVRWPMDGAEQRHACAHAIRALKLDPPPTD